MGAVARAQAATFLHAPNFVGEMNDAKRYAQLVKGACKMSSKAMATFDQWASQLQVYQDAAVRTCIYQRHATACRM